MIVVTVVIQLKHWLGKITFHASQNYDTKWLHKINGKSVHLTSKQLVKIREYLLLVMTNQ